MDYELCKKLKEAGFPQRKEWEEGYFYCADCKVAHLFKDDPDEGRFVGNDYSHRWNDWKVKNWITLPTLEELIEACGNNFNAINKQGMKGWQASGGDIDTDIYDTASEAVANLWLQLNKK